MSKVYIERSENPKLLIESSINNKLISFNFQSLLRTSKLCEGKSYYQGLREI